MKNSRKLIAEWFLTFHQICVEIRDALREQVGPLVQVATKDILFSHDFNYQVQLRVGPDASLKILVGVPFGDSLTVE